MLLQNIPITTLPNPIPHHPNAPRICQHLVALSRPHSARVRAQCVEEFIAYNGIIDVAVITAALCVGHDGHLVIVYAVLEKPREVLRM
jgi:hypothetical protein